MRGPWPTSLRRDGGWEMNWAHAEIAINRSPRTSARDLAECPCAITHLHGAGQSTAPVAQRRQEAASAEPYYSHIDVWHEAPFARTHSYHRTLLLCGTGARQRQREYGRTQTLLHEFARGASATLCRPLSGLPSRTRVFRYFAEARNICGVEDILKVDTVPLDAALMPRPQKTFLTSFHIV
jgi:hypothetical protein